MLSIEQTIDGLRLEIDRQLSFLSGTKAALFGLPLHGNIGDSLISIGEYAFCDSHGIRIISERLLIDVSPLPDLPDNCVILLQGGGDFGDVWRGIQEARIKIIRKYSNHKIVVFPQTVYYSDQKFFEEDISLLSACQDLTICVRDNRSFSIINSFLEGKVILVPDMAFYIPEELFKKYVLSPSNDTLFLRRKDQESRDISINVLSDNTVISDWPSLEKRSRLVDMSMRLVGYSEAFRLRGYGFLSHLLMSLCIGLTKHMVYPSLLRQGVSFLSSFKKLYLSRMHAGLLTMLIGRHFTMIENSYGKNSSFYDTWLSDTDGVKLLS